MIKPVWLVLAVMTLASVTDGQERENVGGGDVCTTVNDEIRTKATEITKRYEKTISERTTDYKAQAASIKENAPKPEGVEAAVGFDIEVTSHDQEILLDLPEVTVKDQTMSMDLPQMTMSRKEMSFDNPTVVMRTQCIEGPPEVVCTNGGYHDDFGIWWPTLDCKTRPGPQICTDIPTVEMRRVNWSMDVPETKLARTEWVMGVPEFKMTTQRIVITVPDFTVKNISVETKKAQEAGSELSSKSKGEMESLSKSLKEEVAANAANGISSAFACQRAALKNRMDEAIRSIDANIAVVSNALEDARVHKANDLANSLEQAQKSLVTARQDAVSKLETEMKKMTDAEKAALSKAVSKDLPELKV